MCFTKASIKRPEASGGLSEAILSSKLLIFRYLRYIPDIYCIFEYSNFPAYIQSNLAIFLRNKTEVFSQTDVIGKFKITKASLRKPKG
jgi:hypothetical protein